MNGFAKPDDAAPWDQWIAARDGNIVALRDPSMLTDFERDLAALSRADLDVLAATWDAFGHMSGDPWALVKHCHMHCHEWEDPGQSSFKIPLVRLLRAVGYGDDAVDAVSLQIEERAALQRSLA